MSYRKLKADYLFDGHKIYEEAAVLICGQDGTLEAIVGEKEAGGDVEEISGMLSPGFINSHCHLELSHLKGLIPEKQGLVNFVFSVVNHRNLSGELKLQAMITAESDMLRSGIVAVGDICNTSDSLIPKAAKRMAYFNFIELFGWLPAQATARFEAGEKLIALFSKQEQNEEHQSLNPHAPYSVSDELWNLLAPRFRGKTITIHNQESAAENEFFESGKGDLSRMYTLMNIDTRHFKVPGTRSLPYYLPKLKTASKILLVHNSFMKEADMMQARSFSDNLFFCLCPNANRYIEDCLPDIPLFVKNKCQIVLGTDSLASNHQLSILEEMKTIKKNFPSITLSQMLPWATSNGARALGFEEKLGDFSRGKKPGIVLLENLANDELVETTTIKRIL